MGDASKGVVEAMQGEMVQGAISAMVPYPLDDGIDWTEVAMSTAGKADSFAADAVLLSGESQLNEGSRL